MNPWTSVGEHLQSLTAAGWAGLVLSLALSAVGALAPVVLGVILARHGRTLVGSVLVVGWPLALALAAAAAGLIIPAGDLAFALAALAILNLLGLISISATLLWAVWSWSLGAHRRQPRGM